MVSHRDYCAMWGLMDINHSARILITVTHMEAYCDYRTLLYIHLISRRAVLLNEFLPSEESLLIAKELVARLARNQPYRQNS